MITNPLRLGRRRILLCGGALIVIAATFVIGSAAFRLKPASIPTRVTIAPADRPPAHRGGKMQFDLLAKFLADDRRGRDESGLLAVLSDPASEYRVPSQPHPLLDKSAPLFTLPDSAGHIWNLEERLERGPVVLVFYLNYGCNACVSGLFDLNADFPMLQKLGAQVAAISDDPPELTRRRFQRYGAFSFPVLSDPGHSVAAAYSIFRPADADQPEQLLHGTFVIGQDRQVKWVQTGDAPFTSNTAVLFELAQLKLRSSVAAAGARAESTETEKQ